MADSPLPSLTVILNDLDFAKGTPAKKNIHHSTMDSPHGIFFTFFFKYTHLLKQTHGDEILSVVD